MSDDLIKQDSPEAEDLQEIESHLRSKELEPVAEALEIRTEDENKSFMCKAWYNDSPCNKHCGDTEDCLFYPKDL